MTDDDDFEKWWHRQAGAHAPRGPHGPGEWTRTAGKQQQLDGAQDPFEAGETSYSTTNANVFDVWHQGLASASADSKQRDPSRQTGRTADKGGSRTRGSSGVGMQTRAQRAQRLFDTWTQGVADLLTETKRQVREIIGKLAGAPAPDEQKALIASLATHVATAKRLGAKAMSRPNGRETASAVADLVAEAQPHLQAPSSKSNSSDPAAIAERGIQGSSVPLPHREILERSFSPEDLAGVNVHVGGPAAEASKDLGAHAYSYGDHIAFASEPSVDLLAHELTHTRQQRGGVARKGIDGGASDSHERQADAVGETIARGESAAGLLASIPRGSGRSGGNAVQRKSSAEPAAATPTDGPATTNAPGKKWAVFADNGLPYKIISAQPPIQFWTISDWIRAGEGFQPNVNGRHAASPACAREIILALGWVPQERVELASKHVVFDISHHKARTQVEASAFFFLGMPSATPIVSRVGSDIVEVATRLDDPNVPPGTRIEIDDAMRMQVIRALAEFTGLTPEPHALSNLKGDHRFDAVAVQSGVVVWKIDPATGNEIFGFDETSDDSGPYTHWLHRKQDKPKPPPKAPGEKLQNFYGEPVPGKLVLDRDFVEAGQMAWLEIDVAWPKHYPSEKDYAVVPMVTPGHRGNVALLKCDWKFELVGGNATSSAGSTAAAPHNAPSPTQSGAGATSVPAASPPTAQTASGAPASSQAAAAVPQGTNTSTAAASGGTAQTVVAEHHHMFVLPPGQASGTFRVTVHASFDEYFAPAEFTKTVEVRSTTAAMKQLGDAAYSDLGARETSRTGESFDATGSGDDNHGFRTAGELPPSFKPSSNDAPDPRAASREDERKRLEATRMYLEANGARKDVLAAVDREIEASRATESALARDRNNGWQPFQIRGTYLSREDDVPTGPLTLYGTVHSETAPGLQAHHVQQTPDRGVVVVQIRDLTRRFDNQDLTFTGTGENFESALKDAFTKNAKAYPKGVMAIEAEAIEAHANGSVATIGKGNGKTIGFELGTDSRWKRASAAVWSPMVNIATNLGAMALMAFVPGSAVVVAPLLVTYNSVPAVDRLRTESERGTLTLGTAATSVGEIALNVLPLVGKAKSFTTQWFLIEGANWGGQAILMTASALQTARQLQSQDVAALASMYEELQALESKNADPAAIEQKRAEIKLRAKTVSERIEEAFSAQIANNALMAAAGSVIHNAASAREGNSIIDAYMRVRGVSHDSGELPTTLVPASPGGQASTEEPIRGDSSPNDASGAAATTTASGSGAAPKDRPATTTDKRATGVSDADATPSTESASSTTGAGAQETPTGSAEHAPDERPGTKAATPAAGSTHDGPTKTSTPTSSSPTNAAQAVHETRYAHDVLTVGKPPKDWEAHVDWLRDESHWVPERQELHRKLLNKAHEEATKFAAAMMGKGEPTLYAMRGNTASGKTRLAKSGAMPELEAAVRATGDGRSINPDNFKGELMRHGGFTANEVHMEASALAKTLQLEMKNEHTADGKPSSMFVDKRLLGLSEIEQYAELAKSSGRKFVVYDVDTPLENSLVGVLGRKVGGNDPLVPFRPVADGFASARANRLAVIQWFEGHREAEYTLYGTAPDGAKIKVASVKNGALVKHDKPMFDQLIEDPADAGDKLGDKVITQAAIDEIVGEIGDKKYALQVANDLKPYINKTWKEAVDAHSKERPASTEGTTGATEAPNGHK